MRYAAIAITAVGLCLTGPMGQGWARHDMPPGGDIQAGKATAAICAACHGADGLSRAPGAPHLAGQHAAYIYTGLKAYEGSERTNENMHGVVMRLSDADMVNVATYYASLKPFSQLPRKAGAPPPVEEDPFAAVREATASCAGCHGEDGNTDIPGTPGLAGQHMPYLIAALKSYQDSSRSDETMQVFAEPLSSTDIEEMAFYYAAMEPKRAETPVGGDAYAGLAVTAPCAGCHAEDGNNKDPKTPRLAGLDAEYLVAAAMAYKDGRRSHDVMRDAVFTLRETDIRDMAAFYGTKEPKALPVRKPLTITQWVEKCDRCHGTDGFGTDPRFPILAGQDEAYLKNALKLYHGGQRSSHMMYAMSFLMAESDIGKMATYYARQRAAP